MSDDHHLDATAGAQLALVVAVKLLLTPYKGNSAAHAALQEELESMKADLLGSHASDYKIEAFEAMAESLLEVVSST